MTPGYLAAKQIVKDQRLWNKTKTELRTMVKDPYFHRVETNYPGYHPKTTIIEILSAELQEATK